MTSQIPKPPPESGFSWTTLSAARATAGSTPAAGPWGPPGPVTAHLFHLGVEIGQLLFEIGVVFRQLVRFLAKGFHAGIVLMVVHEDGPLPGAA
jgi:hypothetical protein